MPMRTKAASFNASDALISLTNADSGIHYGDTKHGAENAWSAVGSMDNDAFRVADGEMVTRADMTFGGAKIGISLGDDTTPLALSPVTEKDYISLGITGSAGAFSYALAHQNANTACLTVMTTQHVATSNNRCSCEHNFGWRNCCIGLCQKRQWRFNRH